MSFQFIPAQPGTKIFSRDIEAEYCTRSRTWKTALERTETVLAWRLNDAPGHDFPVVITINGECSTIDALIFSDGHVESGNCGNYESFEEFYKEFCTFVKTFKNLTKAEKAAQRAIDKAAA